MCTKCQLKLLCKSVAIWSALLAGTRLQNLFHFSPDSTIWNSTLLKTWLPFCHKWCFRREQIFLLKRKEITYNCHKAIKTIPQNNFSYIQLLCFQQHCRLKLFWKIRIDVKKIVKSAQCTEWQNRDTRPTYYFWQFFSMVLDANPSFLQFVTAWAPSLLKVK